MKGRIAREQTVMKIPTIGNIKVGIKNDRGLPQSLDYFIASGKYSKMFEDAFGEKPNKIEVIFLSDILDEVCNERYEIRKGTKLFGWGDGSEFMLWDENTKDTNTGDMGTYKHFTKEKHPDIMERTVKVTGNEWKQVLTLRFLIPRIKGVFGVWQLTTRGKESSIPQIVSVFDQIKDRAGTVINIPFDIIVEKVKSQKPNSKSSYPVITLIPNISQKSLEKVRSFYEAGEHIKGILNESKISEYEEKLLTDGKENINSGNQENLGL